MRSTRAFACSKGRSCGRVRAVSGLACPARSTNIANAINAKRGSTVMVCFSGTGVLIAGNSRADGPSSSANATHNLLILR